MKINLYYFTILFLISFISLSAKEYPKWDFHPPMDIDSRVSGSFGEIRPNHFHSGVDLTTSMKTGYPVFSIDDGYVSRIAVSPVGFGKALYVAHPNGYTSVYAHLESFSPKIEELVLKMQYEKESFSINEYFKPGEIVVTKGEKIALSGNSGSSGGPHLHFEIRETKEQKPLNVHKFGLNIKDDRPPHIESITIYPLDENSYINGKNQKLNISAVFHSNRFHLRGNPTIKAVGNIGIGVETIDYYPDSWRKCGVYSIELKNNDNQIFLSQLDGFLFSDTRYINSHIDYEQRMTNGKVVQKSFLDINNKLDIYKTDSNRGVINVTANSVHNFEYIIKDADNNSSFLAFKISGDSQERELKSGRGEWHLPNESFYFEKNGVEISMPANTFYDKVLFDKENFIKGEDLDLQVAVLDNKIPFHTHFELKIPVPERYKNEKITVAYLHHNGRKSYVGGVIKNGKLVAKAREGGVYTFAIDTVPPIVQLKAVPAGRNYSNRESIKVSLNDDFSGIASYKCFIDGKWALFEYDPKNRELVGFFKYIDIEKGKRHNLTIVATDNLGNSTTLETNFVY